MLGFKPRQSPDILHGWVIGAQIFHKGALRFLDLQQFIGSVQGQSHRPAFLIDRLHDRLTDPPHGIADEVITLVGIELVQSRHQTDVSFIDQIDQRHTLVLIFLGYIHHKPKIGFDHTFAGELVTLLGAFGKRKFLFGCQQRDAVDFLQIHTQNICIVISVRSIVIGKHGAFRFHLAFSLLGRWKSRCN